jgi:hypothetical protein
MRVLLAVALLIHGTAHVVGFVVPWKLIASAEVPYRTTVLAGAVDIGALGVRIVGIAWLGVALLFVALAGSVIQHTMWWYEGAFLLVGVSLALCVLGLPQSRPGLFANGAIVALLVVGRLLNSYPEVGG